MLDNILTVIVAVYGSVYGLAKLRTEYLNGSKIRLENKKLKQELKTKNKKKR